MKNQGVVKFFAVALVLVCIYQLSFTYKAYSLEQDAKAFAEDVADSTANKAEIKRRYLDSLATEKVFNLGFKNFTYLEVKERQLNLGLDLQGGMNVVLEISVSDIVGKLANNPDDPNLNKAINATIAAQEKDPGLDFINEFRRQIKAINPNLQLAPLFFSNESNSKIKFTSSDDDVIDYLREEANASIDRSFEILEARIDQFGVTQPTIQRLAGSGRVMVELPGIDNPERVRKLLQNTAKLEFYNAYSNLDFVPYLDKINDYLKGQDELNKLDSANNGSSILNELSEGNDSNQVAETPVAEVNDSANNANDSASLNDSGSLASTDTTAQDSANQRNYLVELGFGYNVYRDEQGGYFYAQNAAIGRAMFNDTARINEVLNNPEIRENILPNDVKFAWSANPADKEEAPNLFILYALKKERDGGAALDGDVVENARAVIGQLGNSEVSMNMNFEGARKWKEITEAASSANPKKHIAVVLDNLVYSAPVVNGPIPNGSTSIEGGFTQQEANDLANILKAGKLPATPRIVEEAVVGPSLGQKSINSGLASILVGFLSVILIMFLVYNTAGIIADLAVLLNLFFIIGTLASFQAALTLPGIAGIILTLGMAVDANVLIYERIKEELDAGRTLRNSIANGFKNASSAIIDSNVTTLLTASVLAVFGMGPISGFAIVLIFGIISSLFTAFLLTRVVYENLMKREKGIKFWFPYSKNLLRKANFDFVGRSKIFYAISGIIIIAGIVSMTTRGFDLGVDFEGGWSYVIKIEEETNASDIRQALKEPLNSAPEVKVYGTDNTFKVTTEYLINSQDKEASKLVELQLDKGFDALGKGKYTIESSNKVGPTVADDIKQSAIISILLALIGMFTYIQIRFRRWQFALATIVMLTHDVLVVLSLFTLLDGIVPFSLEIDQAFIAAILTIIGYSINDSVVVFDRVREYLKEHKKEGDTDKVINMALNNTLSRTIMTSVTTIVVVFILFLFGGETIKGFAFALTVGVILGTYSSLCIGSPMSAQLIRKQENKAK